MFSHAAMIMMAKMTAVMMEVTIDGMHMIITAMIIAIMMVMTMIVMVTMVAVVL